MHSLISAQVGPIAALCRRYGVRRLDVFGSVLRDNFDPAKSDVDLTVEFDPVPIPNAADQYVRLRADLESLLQLPVDLVQLGSMEDTHLKRLIERTKVSVYAAPV